MPHNASWQHNYAAISPLFSREKRPVPEAYFGSFFSTLLIDTCRA